jgi:hypothetical protein
MKKIIIYTLAFCLVAFFAWADSATYNKKNAPQNGKLEVHKWAWVSTDGTFDLDDATSNSKPIWGAIVGVHFDPGPTNAPDSDYTVYLYDDRVNFDWAFGKGANLDGTTRTASTNIRTPLTADDSYPIVYGVRLRPYVTGPGAGTRQGTIYLTIKIF